MKLHFILAGMLALSCMSAWGGEVYRWVDSSGNVHYGDKRSAEAAAVEKKKFSSAATTDETLPFETRRAAQNFPVTLYVADNCIEPCKDARKLLQQRGVPFSEKKLTTQQEIDEFRRLSGAESVPVLSVGKSWLKGYQASRWHDELDTAGYPKSAPNRAQTTAQ